MFDSQNLKQFQEFKRIKTKNQIMICKDYKVSNIFPRVKQVYKQETYSIVIFNIVRTKSECM